VLARIHEKQEDYAEAETELRARIAAAPDDPWWYYGLGTFLERRERWMDASRVFEQALAVDEGHLSSLYQIGRIGALSGQNLARAEQALLAYLTHDVSGNLPSHAWAQYRLGLVYEHQGETAQARQAFQSSLTLDPEHKEAKKALKSLR